MSLFKHFSHYHPLIFNEEKDMDEEINQDHLCHICTLPILLSSFYSCSVTDCKYFLHEPCALLRQKIGHPRDPSKYLDLVKQKGICYCTKCHQECKNLHYCDGRSSGNSVSKTYHLHPLCFAQMEIKSKHKSHPAHPVVAVCKETSAHCDVCGEKHDGYFFSCTQCNFWIHVECALLPRFVKCTKHRHPFIHSYSTDEYARDDYASCVICLQKVLGSGAYLCVDCKGYAHVSCVTRKKEDLGTETKVEIIDLPFDDLDALWSWTTQNLQKLELDKGNSAYDLDIHNHGLIIYSDNDHGIEGENSNRAYTSSQESLPFSVHNLIVSPFVQRLRTWRTKESLCSLFCCIFCRIPSNGLSYHSDLTLGIKDKDIACLSAPKFIKHESHKQHVLYHFILRHQSQRKTLNCCSVTIDNFWYAYTCVDCEFMIHIHCALLPKRVKHKFDVHPLNLITTNKDKAKFSDYFCEFCEKDIDTSFWYYGCKECDNLFHIKCIPSVGYLSRVKFGNSISVPFHPTHQVTFVRMLGYGSQICGFCENIILGFVDDMAFHCSICDFWMHFKCAEESTETANFETGERPIF
ncbi:uncharacterized protein [Henckelia pumila]|uniref:uncharacterized protein n=1 Tax=Henckelia pumila TaxID=405737 RepID=UPI003C6DF2A2